MKRLLYLLPLLIATCLQAQERGDLVGAQNRGTFTYTQILNVYNANGIPEIFSPIEYDVKAYRLSYRTPAATGDSLTLASGLLLVPEGDCAFPLFCYNHGTSYYGEEVSDLKGEFPIGLTFAANGYVTVMPDYLGYGATPISHPHPYVHAATEASAVIDMLRAARAFLAFEQVRLSEQLFLSGYSQGGHVAMATHRAMEQDFPEEFALTASVPGSGPYDISATTTDSILAEKPTSSYYLGFVLTSYQYVYGNLWTDPAEVFVPPYDAWIPEYFDRTNPTPRALPDTAVRMLRPDWLAQVRQDSLHPAQVALRANDVYDWTPEAPIRMYYCEADEQVPYQNALVAQAAFVDNGASQTVAISAGETLDHVACAVPTLLFAKGWFDSFRDSCTAALNTGLHTARAAGLQLGPNPFRDAVSWTLPAGHGYTQVTVYDLQGRRCMALSLQPGQLRGHLAGRDLAPGLYQAVWQGPAGRLRVALQRLP